VTLILAVGDPVTGVVTAHPIAEIVPATPVKLVIVVFATLVKLTEAVSNVCCAIAATAPIVEVRSTVIASFVSFIQFSSLVSGCSKRTTPLSICTLAVARAEHEWLPNYSKNIAK